MLSEEEMEWMTVVEDKNRQLMVSHTNDQRVQPASRSRNFSFRAGSSPRDATRRHHRQASRDEVSSATTTMPIKEVQTPYPRIDSDPHFTRVVRYFRPGDYAAWAGTAAALPAAVYFWGMLLPGVPTRC